MNFFRQITEKPWISTPSGNAASGREFALPTVTVGLRVFLIVVTVVFTLLTVSYFGRMAYPDWRSLPDPWLLWVNTALLIACSIAFQNATHAARRMQIEQVRTAFLTGGFLTVAFLIGQILAWRQLAALGYFASGNPATAFFYVITGLHGLHLVGGLVAWARTYVRLSPQGDFSRLRLAVELCTVYWHFLLLVWLVMFGLLILT